VVRNFINRRIDMLASHDPDRARLLRRLSGDPPTETGSIKDGPMKLGNSEPDMGSRLRTDEPFSRSRLADDMGQSRLSFATSLSQMLVAQAREQRSLERENSGDGPMGLGARSPNYSPRISMPSLDVWVEGHLAVFDDDLGKADRSGQFSILYAGADYLIKPGVLIGALVQYDRMDDKSTKLNTEIKGDGWMIGPYMGIRLSQNLMFDARAAWGQSDNHVNPIGLYTDSFSTDRWLARANLTGHWMFGNWRLTPSAAIIHVEETQHSYTDTLGVLISSQKASLGRVTSVPRSDTSF
jgi:hypothetical protein